MADEDWRAEVDGTDRTGPTATHVSLSLDATFDMLADSERREILGIITESPGNTITVNELVSQLVQREADESGELPSPDSVEMRIHHIHLPKLIEVGLAEYDARNEAVRYWPDDRLERWLQWVHADDPE